MALAAFVLHGHPSRGKGASHSSSSSSRRALRVLLLLLLLHLLVVHATTLPISGSIIVIRFISTAFALLIFVGAVRMIGGAVGVPAPAPAVVVVVMIVVTVAAAAFPVMEMTRG